MGRRVESLPVFRGLQKDSHDVRHVMSIDPSGKQVLLVSPNPTHLQARRCRVIFSVSLRTWIASLRIHECLRRNRRGVVLLGCVFIIICIWLLVNSLSSTVNGYSEARWPMSNVGVYSYTISTQSCSTSSEHLYSVVLWLCKNRILSHVRGWSCHWVTLATVVFHGSVWHYTPVRCFLLAGPMTHPAKK